jgi:hypothetical protein
LSLALKCDQHHEQAMMKLRAKEEQYQKPLLSLFIVLHQFR